MHLNLINFSNQNESACALQKNNQGKLKIEQYVCIQVQLIAYTV